jgi:FkbM family methyltransferase
MTRHSGDGHALGSNLTQRARRLLAMGALAGHVLAVTWRTQSLVFARIFAHASRRPRRVPGVIDLPIGPGDRVVPMHYVDAESLVFLYDELFVDRAYAVTGMGAAPRIIDCGGNVGLSALWFARAHPGAHITVYEADPRTAEALEANVRAWRLRGVDVVRAAVSDQDGQVSFVTEGTTSGYVSHNASYDGGAVVSVESVRLAGRILADAERGAGPVDLLKMDIEGSEYAVIRDLCTTGALAHVLRLICEIHTDHATEPAVGRLWTALTDAGFRLTIGRRVLDNVIPHPDVPPFSALRTAPFAMVLYAWRPDVGEGRATAP